MGDLRERYEKQGPVKLEDIEMDFDELKIGNTDEYSRLEAVALHIPRRKEILGHNPQEVMFNKTPNYERLLEEISQYRELLKSLDIEVYDDVQFKDADIYGPFPNLIYMRDLGVVTEDRLILANPKYDIRKGEQEIMLATLRRNGYIGPVMDLPKNVTMEGADFFWVNKHKAIISVGNRTSPEFAELFSKLYPNVEVRTVDAHSEGIPQHILGCKHIVDSDTLISRKAVNKDNLGYSKVIELDETDEVVHGYSMNIVTVGPMEIIMPAGNPETKAIYESNGIKVHETPCYELRKMGGALACATLPLRRKMK